MACHLAPVARAGKCDRQAAALLGAGHLHLASIAALSGQNHGTTGIGSRSSMARTHHIGGRKNRWGRTDGPTLPADTPGADITAMVCTLAKCLHQL